MILNPSTMSESFTKSLPKAAKEVDNTPERFMCPLSMTIMNEPVETPYGDNFERQIIRKYLKKHGKVCPLSGRPLKLSDLTPNSKLQWEVLYWQRRAGSPPMSPSSISSNPANDASPRSLSSTKTNTTTTTRRNMVRQDSFVDAAPRKPRRSTRCDMTLSLDLSQHDSKPNVPRRKNSDNDLCNTFMLACQASLEASCTSKLFDNNSSNKMLLSQDTMQSMILNDLMNSFVLDNSGKCENALDLIIEGRSEPKSILSVLDEVEATISLDLFQ